MIQLKLVPLANEIIGRTVDVVKTQSGLILPEMQKKGVTVFVLVDAVGPNVKRCKVGDIILPHRTSNIFLRGGFHRVLVIDEEVRLIVENLSLEQCSIESESR